jgi:hypothetical protein
MVLNIKGVESLFQHSKDLDTGISEKNKNKINISFETSNTIKTKTTTTYTTLISKSHRSITGKVLVIAIAPILATGAYADISLRLTEGGDLINGTEMLNLWCEGDGARIFTAIGVTEPEVDKAITYALQWKQGEAEANITTGGTFGNYSISIQDINL